MKRLWVGALCAGFAVTTAQGVRADYIFTGGKTVAYATVSNLPLTGSYANLLQLQLQKGKKKRVVEVDVQITETGAIQTGAIGTYVAINGQQMEPTQSNVHVAHCNTVNSGCTVTARYWADLDAFEAASPGSIVGQPLAIDIYGVIGGLSPTGTFTARARMLKK